MIDPTLRKRTCHVCGQVFATKRMKREHVAAVHLAGEVQPYDLMYLRACAADAIARRPDLNAVWLREMASTSPHVSPLSPELKARADAEWEML